MLVGRKQERDRILRELALAGTSPDVKRIVSIHGVQGVGTSALASCIRDESISQGLADVVLYVDTSDDRCCNDAGLFSALLDSTVFTGDAARKAKCTELRERCSVRAQQQPIKGSEFSATAELTEALVVDLLQSLYPLYEDEHQLQPEPASPKKIIIIIDRHSQREDEVDSWLLDDVLLYSYIKSFSDIRFYASPYVQAHIPIRRFLDIRIVVAGKSAPGIYRNKGWERWKPAMLSVPLQLFGKREVNDILLDAGIKDVDIRLVEQCFEQTGGHPALVASWLMRNTSHFLPQVDTTSLPDRSWSYFTRSLSIDELRYARIAAACEIVDDDVLRCFLHNEHDRQSAMNFFIRHWAFAQCPAPHSNAVFVREQARLRLLELSTPAGEQDMDRLKEIYSTHKLLMDALPNIQVQHLQMLLSLIHI